jgi:transposase
VKITDPCLRAEGKRANEPVLGIDVHAKPLAWAVIDPNGIVEEIVTENSTTGVNSIITACRMHGVKMVAMESTAEYWLLPYWQLMDAGIPVIVVNPLQVKAVMGPKTDKLDARRVAFALRDGRLRPSVACNREQYALRKDMRELVDQVELGTQCAQQLHAIFHRGEAPALVSGSLASNRGRTILLGMLRCTSHAELLSVVTDAYSKYKGKIDDPDILDGITGQYWGFARRLEGNGDMERFALILDDYLAHEQKVNMLEKKGLLHAKNHPEFLEDLKLLLSFPAIGTRTALAILAEIVDIGYFRDGDRLSQWTGLVPTVKQSGYRKRVNGRITKQGNKYLRRAVWLVAQRSFGMHHNVIHQFITRLIVDGHKPKMKAITAGAHKVLLIIHAMLTKKQEFKITGDEEAIQRQEVNTARKLRSLVRMLKNIQRGTLLPGLVKRLEARHASCIKIAREVEVLAASLLGDGGAGPAVMLTSGGG